MTFEEVLKLDRVGHSLESATAYEGYLVSQADSPQALEAMLNLACVYWQSCDLGTSASENLTDDFVAQAARRWPGLLQEAALAYPHHPAPPFWLTYIAWASLGENLDLEQCRRLLASFPDYDEPALALFAASGGTEAKDRAARLLITSRSQDTARSRYIRSALESHVHPKL